LVSDILAGDGKNDNLFLQCQLEKARQIKPSKPTKKRLEILSYVLLESPFASVSTDSKGHPSLDITVDFAMAASQNVFCSYKLSIHKKTNIMKIMTKKYFNFYLFNPLS
jgi:hypothetical protein